MCDFTVFGAPVLQASVCMVKAEDAKALATSAGLSIRDRHITASVAKVNAYCRAYNFFYIFIIKIFIKAYIFIHCQLFWCHVNDF